SLLIGNHDTRFLDQHGTGGLDTDTRQHGTAGVADQPGESALGRGGGRKKNKKCQNDEQQRHDSTIHWLTSQAFLTETHSKRLTSQANTDERYESEPDVEKMNPAKYESPAPPHGGGAV